MDPLTPDQPDDAERRRRRLQRLGLNAPDPEAEFDRTARIAASLTQAPLAMVNFINDKQQMFRGMYAPRSGDDDGQERRAVSFDLSDIPDIPRSAPTDYGFCPHVVAQGAQLALDDVFDYPRFKGNPLVNEMGVRAYLGTPLRDHTGVILGTVCVADMRPREWDRGVKESMQQLAETLLSEFRLRDSLLTQQEEMFAVFDGAPWPIMLTEGPKHVLRYANGRQGDAFGRVQRLSEGRTVLPGLDTVGVFKAMDDAYRTGQTTTLAEARLITRDADTPQTYSFTCTPVRLSPNAPVSGILTVAMNVTSRPATEDPQQVAAEFTQQLAQFGTGDGWTQQHGGPSGMYLR
ncbi:GAF domain-containing protein [Streptomyces sp. RKND-216]|uniref:GAF domain-containing protein n=1 Tax=Streptomyces sp. RKND-216 TaxID=2562581 RepID=UPI00109E130F|nr:GAF domain-containing protein [Streptomyces sp. RKND-216]THA25303.1 GAF domain-containing protein [Streptomyces sp. RKND-216]